MDDLTQAKKALDKAKIQLMTRKDSAFFTTVCFSLRHTWDDSIPTACTNGKEIRFNPDFFLSLTQEEQLFLILHETLHVAFIHMTRLSERDPQKWNMACDYVINAMLINRGFTMPEGGLYEAQYDKMTSEQVYALLPPPPPEFSMDLEEPGEPVEATKAAIDDILVRAKLQSRMQNESAGAIPGEIEIYINALLKPKLPWHRILQKYLTALSKTDYSFRKPNRRFFPTHYLPSLYSESLVRIAVAVDTSGSVTPEDFSQFVAEVAHILRYEKPESLTLIQFDTQIKSDCVLTDISALRKVTFHGGGGTRIGPVMDWAQEHKPHVLLIFTDGHFLNTSPDPRVPLVWVINDNLPYTAPYGKTIHYTI